MARGEADQLFVSTAGIGRRVIRVSPGDIRVGDRILVSGSIAEHGIAVMSERRGIAFGTEVQSDSAPVWPLVKALVDAGIEVHAMRDPTRGGLAACCVEMATSSRATVELEEARIPVRTGVRAACELLGLDPLVVANEGKLVAFVAEADAARALEAMRAVGGRQPSSARCGREGGACVPENPFRRGTRVGHALW